MSRDKARRTTSSRQPKRRANAADREVPRKPSPKRRPKREHEASQGRVEGGEPSSHLERSSRAVCNRGGRTPPSDATTSGVSDRATGQQSTPGPCGRTRGARRRAEEASCPRDEEPQPCWRRYQTVLLLGTLGVFIVACVAADLVDRKYVAALRMKAGQANVLRVMASEATTASSQTGISLAASASSVVAAGSTASPAETSAKSSTSRKSGRTDFTSTMATGAVQGGPASDAGVKDAGDNRAQCGPVRYTYCQRLRHEFYYDRERAACVAVAAASEHAMEREAASRHVGGDVGTQAKLCNISPNRFVSLEACRRSCQGSQPAAASCLLKSVFSECPSEQQRSAGWFFDGRRCHSWDYTGGRCPVGRLFRTRGECSLECVAHRRPSATKKSKKKQSCGRPRSEPCRRRQPAVYPFFAHVSSEDGRVRCLRASGTVLLARRCLVGSNRFATAEQCRSACVHDPDSEGSEKVSIRAQNHDGRATKNRVKKKRSSYK